MLVSFQSPATAEAVATMPEDYYGKANGSGSEDEDQRASIGLKVRALPLIDLLERSAQNQAHVMWDFK